MNKCKVAIKSDFVDNYDYCFDVAHGNNDCFIWERISTDGPNKLEQFEIMENHGLIVPNYWHVKDFNKDWYIAQLQEQFVVYMDIDKHRGEGKELFYGDQVVHRMDQIGDKLICDYCRPMNWDIFTYRCLVIGRKKLYWFRCCSNDEWRSNVGHMDGDDCMVDMKRINDDIVYFMREGKEFDDIWEKVMTFNYPMYAIDFVISEFGYPGKKMVAVDFNIAPGIHDNSIDSKEIYKLVCHWFENNK